MVVLLSAIVMSVKAMLFPVGAPVDPMMMQQQVHMQVQAQVMQQQAQGNVIVIDTNEVN